MKKLILLVFVGLLFMSCEKEDDCNCEKTVYKETVENNLSVLKVLSINDVECQKEQTTELGDGIFFIVKCD